jgi:hypothetical protein
VLTSYWVLQVLGFVQLSKILEVACAIYRGHWQPLEYVKKENVRCYRRYIVKKRFASFPSTAEMSLPSSPWAGIMTSYLNYSCPVGVLSVTPRLETGNSWTFFYGVESSGAQLQILPWSLSSRSTEQRLCTSVLLCSVYWKGGIAVPSLNIWIWRLLDDQNWGSAENVHN